MHIMYCSYVSLDFLLDDHAPLHVTMADSFGFLEVSELFHKIGKDQEKQSGVYPTTHHWI